MKSEYSNGAGTSRESREVEPKMEGARKPLKGLGHSVARLFRGRFAVLFAFLLASLLVYPYAESSTLGYYAFRIVASAVILLTVYAAAVRRGVALALLVLTIPSLFHKFFLNPGSPSTAAVVGATLSLSFDLIVIAVIFRAVYSDMEPDTETIFGALCIYLLIGYSFAGVYSLIARLDPGAFYLDPMLNRHSVPDRFDLIFFSFGTMTELGAAGVVAVSREVRSVSLLEAVIGILYLAILISRLMSAYRVRTIRVGADANKIVSEVPESSEDRRDAAGV